MRAALLRAARTSRGRCVRACIARVADADARRARASRRRVGMVEESARGSNRWRRSQQATRMLRSGVPRQRRLALAPPAHRETTAALLSALRDDAWQVREEAATTLGKPARRRIARGCGGSARRRLPASALACAARARTDWRQRERAHASLPCLSHSISNVRKEAALALGEIGSSDDAPTLSALEAAEADGDPEVRKAARIALRQIAGRRP